MKDLLFTFPGKAGDNLLRLPIAYQYCKQKGISTNICLDKESEFLVSLFKKQSWVKDVFINDGIWDYSYGGQPYDFGRDAEFKKEYKKVFHLGFVSNCYGVNGNGKFLDYNNDDIFKQIYSKILDSPNEELLNTTLISAIQSECDIVFDNLLTEPSIEFEKKLPRNLCIHIKTQTPERYIDSKETILKIYDTILSLFDNVYIIGKESDKEDYLPFLNNEKTSIFDDKGDLNKTVEILSESILIGTYGSMWALANCMKIEQVVIFDDINSYQGKISYNDNKFVLAYDSQALLKTIIELKKSYKFFHGQLFGSYKVDKIIRDYFPEYNYKGTMIDIGAAAPTERNNSYHFECNGWDTYCIEANPKMIPALKQTRKHVLNYAISNFDKDNVDFEVICVWGNNMEACSALRIDRRLEEQHKYNLVNKYKIPVNVRTLNSLLANEIQINNIDVLSVDTEGTELDVLMGFDIDKWQPKLIICENNFDTNECRDYLEKFGYSLDQKFYINDFFIRK